MIDCRNILDINLFLHKLFSKRRRADERRERIQAAAG
jgi:hypothetical protein